MSNKGLKLNFINKYNKSLQILNMFPEKDITWRTRIITEFNELFCETDYNL